MMMKHIQTQESSSDENWGTTLLNMLGKVRTFCGVSKCGKV